MQQTHSPQAGERTQSGFDAESRLAGYALITALREDAEDCARPDRARLLSQAAQEIEKLLLESRESVTALKETLLQLNAPDCPSIPDGAMVRGRIVNAIQKAEGRAL